MLAITGLALALNVRGSNLNVSGVSLAFLAAVGLAIVVAVSSRIFGSGDARPVTLYMSAAARVRKMATLFSCAHATAVFSPICRFLTGNVSNVVAFEPD